jgi:hypothetical protein
MYTTERICFAGADNSESRRKFQNSISVIWIVQADGPKSARRKEKMNVKYWRGYTYEFWEESI